MMKDIDEIEFDLYDDSVCDNCKFYHIKGRCRRHAPIVNLGFPVVTRSDWCGDFKR